MNGSYKEDKRESKAKDYVVLTGATAGLTALLLFAGVDVAHASELGIDEKAKKLYDGKFLTLAKWVIIGKGGWETINKTIKEDFDGAKRSFLQYLVVYVLLLAFPWSLDQIDSIFAS